MELKFADTNPIVPILKLILGILFFITSLLWILQMYFPFHLVFLATSPRGTSTAPWFPS